MKMYREQKDTRCSYGQLWANSHSNSMSGW